MPFFAFGMGFSFLTCTLCKHISFRHKSLSFFAAKLAQWLHLRLASGNTHRAHSYALTRTPERGSRDDAPGRRWTESERDYGTLWQRQFMLERTLQRRLCRSHMLTVCGTERDWKGKRTRLGWSKSQQHGAHAHTHTRRTHCESRSRLGLRQQ